MIVVLLFVFILLQIADCFTTIYILGKNGKELNPLLAKLFDWIGVWQGLVVIKSIAIAIVLIGTKLLPVDVSYWILGLGNIVYLGVIGWNSYQIYKS